MSTVHQVWSRTLETIKIWKQIKLQRTYPTVHVQYPPYGCPVILLMTICISFTSSSLVLCDGRHRARMTQNDDTLQIWTEWTNCFSWYGRDSLYVLSHSEVKVSVCRRYLFTSVSSTAGIVAISDDQSVKLYNILGVSDCSSNNCLLVSDSAVRGSVDSDKVLASPAVVTLQQWQIALIFADFGSDVSMFKARQCLFKMAVDQRWMSL